MKANVARFLLSSLLREPEKIAIGDESIELSRACLLENVGKQSEAMLGAGLDADDFIIISCGRGIGFWVDVIAAWVIGAKPVCIDATISDEHAGSILAMTCAKYSCAENRCKTTAFDGLKNIPSSFDAYLGDGDLVSTYSNLPFVSEDKIPQLASLIFTSGTTGLPKGVPLTHDALIVNALSTASRLKLVRQDRLMIATPYRFISSISHFLVSLTSGASFFGVERPMSIKDVISTLETLNITAFGGSPFHVQFIAKVEENRLHALRWVMSSGDHLRPAVISQLIKKRADLELHVVYGMAELGGRFCHLPPQDVLNKIGSVGFPINCLELTLRRDDGSICDTGEIGNIHVSGQLGFHGYYGGGGITEQVRPVPGFLNGDKGYLDEDGYLFLSGRSDAVFKRSGLKVSAQVVSDELMNIKGVSDVYVTSEEHIIEGRVPVAYLFWGESNPLEKGEIIKSLRQKIPLNHMPARFVNINKIPRTGSGKIDRKKIEAIIESHEK